VAEIPRLADHTESRFYTRLEACAGQKQTFDHALVTHLMASVDHVAKQSVAISRLVLRYMPQYTLHDETHLLNVLGIMEALVPEGTMARLTPLECGLCIMGAYTHDLGMALSARELAELEDGESPQTGALWRLQDRRIRVPRSAWLRPRQGKVCPHAAGFRCGSRAGGEALVHLKSYPEAGLRRQDHRARGGACRAVWHGAGSRAFPVNGHCLALAFGTGVA